MVSTITTWERNNFLQPYYAGTFKNENKSGDLSSDLLTGYLPRTSWPKSILKLVSYIQPSE